MGAHEKIRRASSDLKTLALGELLETDFPDREVLLTPWLRAGESVMVYAPPGVGKSMLVMSIGLAVAGRGELIGWEAKKPRRVLLVDGEMHIEDLRDRANLLMSSIEGIDPDKARDNLTVLARQYQHPDVEFPDLATDEGRREVLRRVEEEDYDLVILDNFSTLATVADENAASAFDPVIRFLLKMKQAGRACVLVHHSGKKGDDYRGSSKLATTFEIIIGLRPLTTEERKYGTAFEMNWDKYRHKKDETVTGRAVWLDDSAGEVSWEYERSSDEEAKDLVKLVRTGSYASQRELAVGTGWSPPKVTRVKQRAFERQLISEGEWEEHLRNASRLEDDEDEEEEHDIDDGDF